MRLKRIEINGQTFPAHSIKSYRHLSSWNDTEETRQELIKEGFSDCKDGFGTWVKEELTPRYSSQVAFKYIGDEPEPVGGQSVHSHRYYTHYYEVELADFNTMEVKPEVVEVHRSLRLHDFDGICDVTQNERHGYGWKEQESDYHTTRTYVFFIKDFKFC